MTYQVKESDLNQSKYNYIWTRDSGDGPQAGWQDRVKLDKDEGYEVLHMIQRVYDSKQWSVSSIVSQVESYIHSPSLKGVQSSDRIFNHLINQIYDISGYLK